MVDISTLSLVLTGIGLTIAVIYYALTLRNATASRKAQLFMGLYESYRNPDFRRRLFEIRDLKWDTIEEAYQKYMVEDQEVMVTINSVAAYFNGVGILVKKGLIDIELVDEMLSFVLIAQWEILESIILDMRRMEDSPKIYNNFEYIYKELKKRNP